MTATQRYELIRPILQQEKSVQQVHIETSIPISTIYRYLKRYRQGNQQVESLGDKSRAPHSNPHQCTEEEKDFVVEYKLAHPEKSVRQIAKDLAEAGTLSISYRTVANILSQRRIPAEFFSPNPLTSSI